jgi:hypothetical protein
LKVVNNSGISESVNIILSGTGHVNPAGKATFLTAVPEAENSLTKPDNVVPSTGTFVADNVFKYLFPGHSITVLRIGFSR